MRRALRNAITDAKRLAAADQAYKKGDTVVASMIYVQVALSRPPNKSSETAKQRLQQLREEGRQRLKVIDAMLASVTTDALLQQRLEQLREERQAKRKEIAKLTSDANKAGVTSPRTKQRLAQLREELEKIEAKLAREAIVSLSSRGEQVAAQSKNIVTVAFQGYDRLVQQYAKVPQAGDQIRQHVIRKSRRPEFAMVLNEPEAKELWELAQQYEQKDEPCCAYQLYEQAARLTPAPSAQFARLRLAKMGEDRQIVASAEACRELQWCHKTYRQAEHLAKVKPKLARELFAQVVSRAPQDTEVHRAARQQIQSLTKRS